MTVKDKIERKATDLAIGEILKYIDKNPKENIIKLYNLGVKLLGGTFPQKYLDKVKEVITEGDNVYYNMALDILRDLDRGMLRKMLLAMGLGAGVKGTKAVRENREKYKCNIPFLMLMDPTSACNMMKASFHKDIFILKDYLATSSIMKASRISPSFISLNFSSPTPHS